jgi:exodeoxyribonuclease-3
MADVPRTPRTTTADRPTSASSAAEVAGVRVASVYVPNGQDLQSDKFPYKLQWIDRLATHLAAHHDPNAIPWSCAGTSTSAPSDALDACGPGGHARRGPFVSPPERRRWPSCLALGLTDAFRAKHPTPRAYSWWDYRAGGWEHDHGLRIDHFLVTRPVLERLEDVVIHRAMRAEEGPSDHVPLVLHLKD